jgi:hypothetical protein
LKYAFTLAASAALFLGLGTSCSEGSVEAGSLVDQVAAKTKGAVGELNLEGLSGDALKGKADEMIAQVTKSLGSIKDLASAEKVKETLMPMVEKFGDLKSMLGENLPDLSSLTKAVNDLKTKFAGNSAVMDSLKPLIEKLSTFLKK